MFGDSMILGESFGKISDKGRIFIPGFAKPNNKDEVVLHTIIYQNELALKIIAFNECLNIISRLQKLRETATSLEEYNKYTQEIEKFSMIIKKRGFLDSAKRIMVPRGMMEELNWAPHDPIIFNGLGESLLVRKLKQNK